MNFLKNVGNGIQLELKKGEREELRNQLQAIEVERKDLEAKGRMDSLFEILQQARNQLEKDVFTPMAELPDAPSSNMCLTAMDELLVSMNAVRVHPAEALEILDERQRDLEERIEKINKQLDKLRGKN